MASGISNLRTRGHSEWFHAGLGGTVCLFFRVSHTFTLNPRYQLRLFLSACWLPRQPPGPHFHVLSVPSERVSSFQLSSLPHENSPKVRRGLKVLIVPSHH